MISGTAHEAILTLLILLLKGSRLLWLILVLLGLAHTM
jgi:hypothetical protein